MPRRRMTERSITAKDTSDSSEAEYFSCGAEGSTSAAERSGVKQQQQTTRENNGDRCLVSAEITSRKIGAVAGKCYTSCRDQTTPMHCRSPKFSFGFHRPHPRATSFIARRLACTSLTRHLPVLPTRS